MHYYWGQTDTQKALLCGLPPISAALLGKYLVYSDKNLKGFLEVRFQTHFILILFGRADINNWQERDIFKISLFVLKSLLIVMFILFDVNEKT